MGEYNIFWAFSFACQSWEWESSDFRFQHLELNNNNIIQPSVISFWSGSSLYATFQLREMGVDIIIIVRVC